MAFLFIGNRRRALQSCKSTVYYCIIHHSHHIAYVQLASSNIIASYRLYHSFTNHPHNLNLRNSTQNLIAKSKLQ